MTVHRYSVRNTSGTLCRAPGRHFATADVDVTCPVCLHVIDVMDAFARDITVSDDILAVAYVYEDRACVREQLLAEVWGLA